MSDFTRVAWNPKERVARAADFMDNHWPSPLDHYWYGVKFDGDETIYRDDEVEIPLDLVLVPQESKPNDHPQVHDKQSQDMA